MYYYFLTMTLSVTNEPLSRLFERATSSLVTFYYLRYLSSSIKRIEFRSHEFDTELDFYGKAANVFYFTLYSYGTSLELLLKFMVLNKTNNLKKTISFSHNLPKLLDEVIRLYDAQNLLKFKEHLVNYKQWLEIYGKYPFDKNGKHPPGVTDLFSMQTDAIIIWKEFLKTIENSICSKEDWVEYTTLLLMHSPYKNEKFREELNGSLFVDSLAFMTAKRIMNCAEYCLRTP